MARHPAQDGLTDTKAVLRHLRQVETRAVVPHKRLHALRTYLDIDRYRRCTVSNGVEQRFAQRPHQHGPTCIESPVTGHHQLDGYSVEVLHVMDDLSHGRGQARL